MSLLIIGVDEVNYSPSLAGDTIVCACILKPVRIPKGLLKDSKQTTHKHRMRAFAWLQQNSIYVIEVAGVNHIGTCGVYKARNHAMYRAMEGLAGLCDSLALCQNVYTIKIDGPSVAPLQKLWNDGPRHGVLEFIVDGDQKVKQISAASIIARVYADALFEGWEVFWPGYGMNKDHGSVGEPHKQRLRADGPTPMHRSKNYGAEWWKKIMGGRHASR